jgi:DNA-directed RNA polymerase specialized sigma24 family protein
MAAIVRHVALNHRRKRGRHPAQSFATTTPGAAPAPPPPPRTR